MAAENDNDRVHFAVGDGESYEYPDPMDLDLDEWVIIYDECGMILEDFAPFDDKKRERERIKRLRNPALIKALAMVGILRATELDVEEAKALVGSAKMLGLLESMAPEGVEAEQANPPTGGLPNSESEPNPSPERRKDDSSGNSSPASPPNSETQEEEPAATGTGG